MLVLLFVACRGDFFKLRSHLSLIQGPREEALWIYEQLPTPVHSSCFYNQSPSHFSLKNIWQALSASSSPYLWNILSQYHYRHFVLAPWSTVSWEVKNIAVFYGTQLIITVFKRVPLVPRPNQVNLVFVLSFLHVRATWILSFHLRLHLPCLFFPSDFHLKSWTHFILLDVFTQIRRYFKKFPHFLSIRYW